MISTLAQKATNKFFPVIGSEDAELCIYSFFILFSKLLSLTEVLLSGIILRNVWNAILFYFVFAPLREYSGGIHARKEKTCIFCTALALFLSIAGIKLLEVTVGCAIQAGLLIVGTSVVFLFSPLDTPEKPLDENERILFGQKSKQLCIAVDLFAVLAYMLGLSGIMNALSMGLALEGILLIAGKIQSSKIAPSYSSAWSYWPGYGCCHEDTYLSDLKAVASCYGLYPENVDAMLRDGVSMEEIEEYIYCG